MKRPYITLIFLLSVSFCFSQENLELDFSKIKNGANIVAKNTDLTVYAEVTKEKITKIYGIDPISKKKVTIHGAPSIITTINKTATSKPGNTIPISGTKVCTTYSCTQHCQAQGLTWCCEWTLKVIPCSTKQ